MATYTQRQAAKIVGKSRTTVGRHIASGRLSCIKNEDGSVAIDASELIRVYGDECNFDRAKKGPSAPPENDPAGADRLQAAQAKLEQLQDKLLRQYRDEIEHLKEALAKAQEGNNRALLLLENRKGGGEWREAFAKLRRQIEQRETQAAVKAKAEARAELLSQPWWRLLGLGRG